MTEVGWLDDIIDSMDIFEHNLRDSEGQRSLACCSPWGHKESDTTEGLNQTTVKKYKEHPKRGE